MARIAAAPVIPFKKQTPPSFGEALAQTAKAPEPKVKKSKMPTLDTPAEVAQAVDDYQEAKTTAKMAEAAMNAAGEIIMEFVRQVQDQDGFAGRFSGSYAVMGHRHQAKVVYANKFSINPEDEGELTAILGEHFDSLIEKKFSVKLKDQVFTDPTLQAELMDLVGARFPDFFETTVNLGVCDNFNQLIYQVVEPEQMGQFRTFARQYKPSIR
jgi:hypothetical protein